MNKDSSKGRGFSEQKLALLASLLKEQGVSQTPSLERIPRDHVHTAAPWFSFAQANNCLD